MENFQPHKPMGTASLDLLFLYTYFVTTNRFFIYRDEKNNYHIGHDHHPLLRSLTDARKLYEIFPEPRLKTHQIDI